MTRHPGNKVAFLLFAVYILASFGVHAFDGDHDQDDGFGYDPILQYRPQFVRSLPVQILLTGVVLTLVSVLFIHLIFTAQYHYPLAPVNYVLQLSGVTTLLISLIATLHVVLQATLQESEQWPYMLSYIAVNVPPLGDDTAGWSAAERALWLVMNASTSGLIQITHIQFLTLLYPSRLEGQLIFVLLAPLAVVSAIMQLLPIHPSVKVASLSSAVRNVCNATLSLLFTISLFFWGFLVNRHQAWRTDGGTAAFGAAALALALVSTALNFLYVPREEEYLWLPGLMWAVVLWQSFLGWWWWVGAGSKGGIDKEEIEEIKKREEKKERRRERQNEARERAKEAWRGVTGAFNGTTRRRTAQERESESSVSPADDDVSVTAPSTASQSTRTSLPGFLPAFMHRWYHHIRQAHVTAARAQAVERSERLREGRSNVDGWGLGNFYWGKRKEPSPPQEDHEPAIEGSPERMESDGRQAGIWWWGPFGRWRLQDATTY